MSSNVLFERDRNVQPASTHQSEIGNPKSMEYHRQVLESRMEDDKAQQTYISPSDNIMSPATKKLADFKNKHMQSGKGPKPQSLFAKTTSKNADAVSKGGLFVDMVKDNRSSENTGSRP